MAHKPMNHVAPTAPGSQDHKPAPDRRMLTAQELAIFLRVNRSTVYRLLKRHDLPGFRIGSEWRFDAAEIDQWFKQRGAGSLDHQ